MHLLRQQDGDSGLQAQAQYIAASLMAGSAMKLHWEMTLKIHREFPVHVHWESDNPLENTVEK